MLKYAGEPGHGVKPGGKEPGSPSIFQLDSDAMRQKQQEERWLLQSEASSAFLLAASR